MAALRCCLSLGVRAAGLLLVAAALVASSTASGATRIAGRYRKRRCKESCAVYGPKRQDCNLLRLASIDLLASQARASGSQGSYARLSDVGEAERFVKASRSACCGICEFWPSRRRVQEGDLQGTSTDARLNLRRHGGPRIAVSKPRERLSHARGDKSIPIPSARALPPPRHGRWSVCRWG